MMMAPIETQSLWVRYGRVEAVRNVSFRMEEPGIYGLLGRNGAGKSTLLAALAGFRCADEGEARIEGQPVFENAAVMSRVCLIREGADTVDHCWPEDRARDALKTAARLRDQFDLEFAGMLADRFDLPLNTRVGQLSRGQRAALAVTLGLASRAPVTLFDEPHLGMDAPSRQRFYQLLLDDFIEHPRTIVISTHLIGEIASLFGQVLIIDRGRLLLQEEADTLRARAIRLIGPADQVAAVVEGMTVIGEQSLGSTRAVSVYGELSDRHHALIRRAGLETEPVSLQELFIHLVESREEQQ